MMQEVTLRLIAERLLPEALHTDNVRAWVPANEVYVQNEIGQLEVQIVTWT